MSNRLINYFKESVKELKKVSWPSKQQVIQHTVLVIVASLVVAAFLGIVDFILTKVLQIVI